MRVLSSGAFHMHDSPRLAAEWLNDADTVRVSRDSGILLSTIVQYQVCAIDTRLWIPDADVMSECCDVATWLGASQHNIAWMLDYFSALHEKCARCFKDKSSIITFKQAIISYLGCFDDVDTGCNWLPLSNEDARRYYRASVKKYQYRKVRMPYWFDPSVRESACEVATSDQFGPLDAGLDLFSFDLDSF